MGAKAKFGQVGDQVSQVKDQVGKGQGQELDNFGLQDFGLTIKNFIVDLQREERFELLRYRKIEQNFLK